MFPEEQLHNFRTHYEHLMSEVSIEPDQPTKPEKISVWDLLQKKFPANEYALMQEVSNAAGFDRSRSADFIAVNLWPSRGLAITGIELKKYRGDWMNELKNPAKAESIFKYCDYFYLLTEDDKIAKLDEIPATWGWMCIKGKSIHVLKAAPILKPVPLDKGFVIAMLKRASCRKDFVHIDTIEEQIELRAEQKKNYAEQRVKHLEEDLQTLNNKIKDFEKATGISIMYSRGWGDEHKKIGSQLNAFMNTDFNKHVKQIETLQQTAERIAKDLFKNIETLKQVDIMGFKAIVNPEMKEDKIKMVSPDPNILLTRNYK